MTRLLCSLLILSASLCHAQQPVGRASANAPKVPDGISYSVHQYRESDPLRAGQLGIAMPNDTKGSLPVVVCIHGGGWAKGDKDQMAWMAIRYAQRGYIGVTISYRLNHEAPLPACILDVKETIRYVKSISDDLHADPERIAVLGYSAGAHLALMIGLSPEAAEFNSAAYPEQDSSVDCVVAISAPADLSERLKRRGKLGFIAEGQATDANFIRSISPLTWMNRQQVPVLMLHGDQDPIVPSYNYENFADKCDDLAIDNFELYVNEGGKHMFFFKEQATTHPIVDRFLAKHLKP
jgi:acetyl esterase/lipase